MWNMNYQGKLSDLKAQPEVFKANFSSEWLHANVKKKAN